MKNVFDLTGKVAIITGASTGLGLQFAHILAEYGVKLAIAARRKDRLDALAAELGAKGYECISVQCDVTQEHEIIAAVDAVKKHYGRIDILVNNSGTSGNIDAQDQTLAQWNTILTTNLTGVYLMAREVGKIMIAQQYGKIINIGSIHSSVAANTYSVSAYCSSKGGVQMLTKALAAEWAKYHITVNCIAPGYFDSEMMSESAASKAFQQFVAINDPMARLGRAGELNGALIYFASDASSYTTGQMLNVDGGWNAV